MELIKKKILRQQKREYNNDGTFKFVDDLDAIYNFNICLTTEVVYNEPPFMSGSTSSISGAIVQSRLSELTKYASASATTLSDHYIIRSPLTGGTGVVSDNGEYINYWIDDIEYVDNKISGGTIANFVGMGYASPDFYDSLNNVLNRRLTMGTMSINDEIAYVDDLIVGLATEPNIISDVFIDRQNISVFDSVYRLEHIDSVLQLETYVGGGFFNIINNI